MPIQQELYKQLAQSLQAFQSCSKVSGHEWTDKHKEYIESLLEYLPSGSGFDSGTKLDWDNSNPEKLVFYTSFHHMDENGCYDGWTEHIVTVRPSLRFEFNISISGRNRNDIKEYMHEQFDYALRRIVNTPIDPFADVPDWDRCISCYGRASVTAENGKRYCDGCNKYHRI